MKKALLITFLIFFWFSPIYVSASSGGYTIDNYNVVINVNQNNVLNVKEQINVNFFEERHGIYRFIPKWLEYTSKDNETQSRRAKLSNLRIEGFDYTTELVNGKDMIRIGSEYKTVYGPINYNIDYDYNMGHDPYSSFDEFIFHMYGDFWDTKIDNPSFEISFPKPIDEEQIYFWCDKYRKCDMKDNVIYYMDGNTLHGTVTMDLSKSLTIEVVLPDKYFVGTKSSYGITSLFICCIIIALTVVTIFWWARYGKNHPRRAKTVEFYPPDDLTSPEICYIYNKRYGVEVTPYAAKKSVTSLIVVLAKKGYIRIDEIVVQEKILFGQGKKIKITKLKEYDGADAYEKIVYDNIFFSTDVDNNKESKDNIDKNENEVILNDSKTFYSAVNEVGTLLSQNLEDKVLDKVSIQFKNFSLMMFVFCVIFWSLAIFGIKDLDPQLFILYWISFVAIIVMFVFALIMGRKTLYAEYILPKIKGFRDFLEKVDKYQLEKFVETNPQYFYDILPYTYVLNLSKKWIEKFEDIKIPVQESMGTFNYFDYSSFDSISSSINNYSSNGSGSGSGSSGCSSCGGGCSSCGGGGSW